MALISLKEVAFAYPHSDFRLEGINLDLNAGEVIVIWGENGTGKTTLLRLAAGLLLLSNGNRRVDPKIRLSFIPADILHFLLPWYTVVQNLAFFTSRGRSNDSSILEESIEYIEDFFTDLPFSFSELRDKKTWQLSTGQRATVAICGCLLTSPQVVFLDETFSNLSVPVIRSIVEKLRRADSDNTCVVYCSHNESLKQLYSTHVFDLGSRKKVSTNEHKESCLAS